MKDNKLDRKTLLQSVSKRRNFLKTTLTLGASALGASASVGATNSSIDRDELQTTAREYYSTDRVRDALETHADDLLTELTNRGLLNSASVSELPVGSLYRLDEFGPGSEGATVAGVVHDGEPMAKIQVRKQLSERTELVVEVVPAEGRSYAMLRTDASAGSDSKTSETQVISPSGCSSGCVLVDTPCEVYCGPYSCTCKVAYYYDCDNCSYCEMDEECSSCSEEGC